MKKKKIRILIFFGTRPEAIKMAPVVAELKKSSRFQVIVAVSAQHRQLLDQVLSLYKIKSNIDFNLMKSNQTLFDITSGVLRQFESALTKYKPDMVLVHGDTTSTLGGSLSAYYKKIPVGHVEAGLRTGDMYRPFPEEINRRLTDGVTTLFFAPTNQGKKNLLAENHPSNKIFVTGNTVIDALLSTSRKNRKIKSKSLRKTVSNIKLKRNHIVLMTAHRRENFGAPFKSIFQTIKKLSQKTPHVHWIYPVHPNPNVKKPAQQYLKHCSNVHLVSPIDYADLVAVMKQAHIVVTDSGGLQEEAPSLGKPVLVLREVTERPEAVRAGTVRLVGANSKKLTKEFLRLCSDKRYYRRMSEAINPYGDGQASKRIRQAIEWYFKKRSQKPSAFRRG